MHIRIVAFALALAACTAVHAAQLSLTRPFGSVRFGETVRVLPNGNIVVADPSAFDVFLDAGGKVHLFRPDGSLISTLSGVQDGDRVGSGGILVLPGGDFLVLSPQWRNGNAVAAGAVTFVDAETGLGGFVGPDNSLVGSRAGDRVGEAVHLLPNGHYVVASRDWDNGSAQDAGAVTFGDGTTGVRGAVSPANSLVGSSAGDRVGEVHLLASGDYVVCSPQWRNGAALQAGAATFVAGAVGRSGTISAANSLVGASSGDRVCSAGIVRPHDEDFQALTASSHYLVRSPSWDGAGAIDAGAVTHSSGPNGRVGIVGPANSVVGSSANDQVGGAGIFRVKDDGGFGITAPQWDRPTAGAPLADAGAAVIGPAGTAGIISPTTALVGLQAGDRVGEGLLLLANGNFVVLSPLWSAGVTPRVGAATFAPAAGRVGNVFNGNSLSGTRANDQVGAVAIALAGGNYVIGSPYWDRDGIIDAGAATIANGSTGITGSIFAGNSLMGARTDDHVGLHLLAVGNGNYVVGSPQLDLPGAVDAGAVTFAAGPLGIIGEISPANSLTGSNIGDRVGLQLGLLANGDYLVGSPLWDRPATGGAITNAGALTRASGTTGLVGVVGVGNSLVGASAGDNVGDAFLALTGGGYLSYAPGFDAGGSSNAGAITLAPAAGIVGVVAAGNSLIGAHADDRIGEGGVVELAPGIVLVGSPGWDDGSRSDVGALTRLTAGQAGTVGAGNSLVGVSADQRLGDSDFGKAPGGYYVVHSERARLGNDLVGAVTLGLRDGRSVGPASGGNTVFGTPMSADQGFQTDFDPRRVQLAVGEADANRVVLLRPGEATTVILEATPSPSETGQAVLLAATVLAASTPGDGRVEFRAATGESCTDTTPTPVGSSSASFSCTVVFTQAGSTVITAEFLGSLDHAYGSKRRIHISVNGGVFGNGFE